MVPSFQSSQDILSTNVSSTQSVSLNHPLLPSNSLIDRPQQGNQLISSSAVSPLTITPGVGVIISDFIGNTLQPAYNIGNLNDSRFNYADSVSSSDTNDVYRFHLDNAATVNVGLSGMSADADLYLLDSLGNTIDASLQGGNSNETINHFLSAGVYYGQVKSFLGVSTSYSLSVNDRSLSGQVSFDYTTQFNGTSAATPNITEVASLVWSANPSLTAAQVKQILSQTATDLGSPGYDPYYGNGFVNADAAVRRAIALTDGAA